MAKQKRRFKGGEIPTSSMADIAFLLLIFFLVTTTIDMDKGLGMVLPAEGEEMEINKKNILNCLINSTGNVLLGGEAVDIKNLAKAVRQKIFCLLVYLRQKYLLHLHRDNLSLCL